MISEPPPKSIQFARVQTAATLLASDVLAKGYARENVAQALVRAARDLFDSDDEFLTFMIGYLQFNNERAWSFKG
jgi:hypothetical protein